MKRYFSLLSFIVAFGLHTQIFSQIPNNLRDPSPMQTLPKLDRFETGKPVKQNNNVNNVPQNDIIRIKGPYLSETDIVNRSQADGKVSPEEKKLIEKARAMPQTD